TRLPPPQSPPPQSLRCLVLERHDWETGAYSHQVQFPLPAAQAFFGPPGADRNVQIRLWIPSDNPLPPSPIPLTISRRYRNSATRRTNRAPILGTIPPSFIFFQETDQPDVYDVW